jgi:hypothetical protein
VKTETEPSLRNVLKYKQDGALDINMTMDNIQRHICTNVPSSENFRSYLRHLVPTRYIRLNTDTSCAYILKVLRPPSSYTDTYHFYISHRGR